MSEQSQKNPAHVASATVAIVLMAIGLAAGLDFLGTVKHLNHWMSSSLVKTGMSQATHSIHPYLLWGGTGAMCLGLTLVLLNVAGMWRRLLVWLVACVITLFWVPVLWLAAHKPEIGVAIIALLWSGFCATVYTMNHNMPADQAKSEQEIPDDATR